MSADFYDRKMSLQQEKTARTPDMVAQREALFSCLKLKRGESFLEVGSGNGILLREAVPLVGPKGKLFGIDYSPDMVELSRTNCPEATFIQASADDLPMESNLFDAALMAQVLCFVEDVPKAVGELYRCLKPGGRVVILDTHWDSLVWNIEDPELLERIRTWIAKPYSYDDIPASLSRQLTDAGFEITGRDIHPVINWSLEPDTYSGQLIEYFRPMAEAEGPEAVAQLDHWISDLGNSDRAGNYLFSICRYIFCATKPDA